MKPLSKIYFNTDKWIPVPLISQELIDAGYENSEACQACPYVVLDPIKGQYGFYAIDCGGVYRTADGGKSWALCTIGLKACAATGMTFDPNNINRVIAIGCNSGYCVTNGIYLSENLGDTWAEKFLPGYEGFEGQLGVAIDHRVQIAFDVTSYDENLGGSRVVYWSREDKKTDLTKNFPAIYKSVDGGETWKKLPGTDHIGGGDIFVNSDGKVIASNKGGVWTSSDGGATWKQVSDLKVNAMFAVPTRPNNVYAATTDAFYISYDFGENFSKIDTIGFPDDVLEFRSLRVSPSNPNHMIIFRIGATVDWDYTTYYSKDGGKSWHLTAEHKEGIWIPMNEHRGTYWYSPVDENYIISNEYRSEDGGENLFVSTKGFNGAAITGLFINVNDDRLIAVSNQDFNGGYSTDGGKTWTYVNWSGETWGGFTYGSYALTDQIVCAAKSNKWWGVGEIVYTTDGGKTVTYTGIEVNGKRVGYGVPGKKNIAFLAEHRTDDYCQTWTKMDGCTGVLTHDTKTDRLFGIDDLWIVYSDDEGITWTKLVEAPDKIFDLEYNSRDDILYVTTVERKLYYYDFCSKEPRLVQNENILAGGVCVDPQNPSIIYISYEKWAYYDTPSVCRSLDGGKTWTNLCRTVGDGRDDCLDGGRNALAIHFIPSTREIITYTNCRGIWKMKACDPSEGTDYQKS